MILGWSFFKVGLPNWYALLNYNLALNCVGSPRHFSSQNCKIESVYLIGLAKWFHSWLSSEQDGVLLEIRNRNEESCGWRLITATSLNLTIISLPRGQTLLDTSITIFISGPSFVTLDDWCVSYSDQVHSLSLGYHLSLSLWFCKWLQTLILHLFCWVMDVKADSTLKFVSTRKFDSVWVIVDRLTRSAHFIPVNTNYNVQKYAEIYIARVLCLHGVPKMIIYDWGSQFVARFWEQLHVSLGTHLIHSSTYHPQTDGQTKRVN
jgi:hypothetical protein